MTTKTKVWIRAARLRTLPLSVSGIIVGNALCLSDKNFSWMLFLLMLLTAMSFQLISNFANDYGDGIKGTDNDARLGPERVFQAGLLSKKELKNGILLASVFALLLAITVILLAFGINSFLYLGIFIALSILCVWAAISYTVGEGAYGYRGLGDLFVFLFFGGVSVLGSYFVQLKTVDLSGVFFAVIIGFLSVGVLNLNNMRDRDNDAAVGKKTLAVFLGKGRAKIYHLFLIVGAAGLLFVFLYAAELKYFWLPMLVIFPLTWHVKVVVRNKFPKNLDPELKKLALTTFLLSILIFITLQQG